MMRNRNGRKTKHQMGWYRTSKASGQEVAEFLLVDWADVSVTTRHLDAARRAEQTGAILLEIGMGLGQIKAY